MAEFLFSDVYKDLTKAIKVRFDKVSEKHVQLFGSIIFEDYLTWDTPSVGLTIDELIGVYNISVAAATIGDNSQEPIIGTKGMQTFRETILNHAMSKPMTSEQYRKLQEIMRSSAYTEQAKKQKLMDTVFGDSQEVVRTVLNKLDLIFLTALSNEGKCTLDATNNPEGGIRCTIDYQQPDENIQSSKTEWTTTNKATVDCMEDIQEILNLAADKVAFKEILCAPSLISYLCSTTKMKQMVWGSDKSSRIVQLKDVNDYMQENGWPVFKPIRRIINVQKGSEITPITPWNAKNMVFIPQTDDGKIGLVKNAFADSELQEDPGVDYFNYGRIRGSMWKVGQKENSKHVAITKAESYSLPVITEMNGIYTLKTQE